MLRCHAALRLVKLIGRFPPSACYHPWSHWGYSSRVAAGQDSTATNALQIYPKACITDSFFFLVQAKNFVWQSWYCFILELDIVWFISYMKFVYMFTMLYFISSFVNKFCCYYYISNYGNKQLIQTSQDHKWQNTAIRLLQQINKKLKKC